MTDFLSALPEWGILGAFVAVVVTLVHLFLAHIKERDKILLQVHKTCEERLESITETCLVTMGETTKAVASLEGQIKILAERLNRGN